METNASSVLPARKKNKWLGKLNSWLHLWLGLGSGIIVFVVALTGTMFVFCDDIIDGLAGKKVLYVPAVKEIKLSPEALLQAFKKELPDRKAFYFETYKDPSRSFKIGSAGKDKKFQFTWMDPYTGKILGSGKAYYFFYVVAHVHSGEMPFGKTGNLIVHIATWIFLIELITGLILWWPKKWNKATRQQSFKVKWKAGFKRVNYDLHNVPGFYSLIPALMITVTGLLIVNDTLKQTLHNTLGGSEAAYDEMRKVKPAFDSTKRFAPLQVTINNLFLTDEEIGQVRISIPAADTITSFNAIAAERIGLKGIDNGSMFTVNRYTGEKNKLSPKTIRGLAIEGWTMNLHIGFWGGVCGKILTLIIGLVCMALPVTGFLIWWGRRNKKSSKNKS